MRRLISILLLILISISAFSTTYHVASSGGDFANLTEVNASTFSPGDSILFNRGETFYGSLTVSNAGTAGNAIIIGAYGTGANPIITGFTDVSSWTNLGSNIWESTNTVSTLSTCEIVTVNGVQYGVGRTPNDTGTNNDYYWIQSHSGKTSITSSDLTGTPDWTGATVVMKTTGYTIERSKITAQSGGTLTLDGAFLNTPIDNFGFWIQNDPRTLDVQNEWYYNPTTHKIRIYSSSQPTNVKVASSNYVITLNAANVTIDGLTITGANKAGIYSSGSETYKTIQNCAISYCGEHGIYIGGNHSDIYNCEISFCNHYGYQNGSGNTSNCIVRKCNVHDIGTIIGSDPLYGGYTGILSSGSSNHANLIDSCTVTNCGFNGISVMGDSIIIKNNYVDTFNKYIADGGGIYIYGESVGYPTKALYNIVSNAGTTGTANYGTSYSNLTTSATSGIYCDGVAINHVVWGNTLFNLTTGINCAAMADMDIEYNTIYNTAHTGISFWGNVIGNTNNFIEHNTIVLNTLYQFFCEYNGWTGRATAGDAATYDYNVYSRPLYDYSTIPDWAKGMFIAYDGTTTRMTLDEWKILSEQETNSTISPYQVTSTTDIVFKYNATSSPVNESLDFPCVDLTNTTKYASSVTVPAYSSVILLKDPNPDASATTTLTLSSEVSYPIYTTSYFTISPNGNYTGSVTITPSGTGATGLLPITKTWSGTAESKVFTITPLAVGSITLTTTNSNGLTNPNPVTFTVTAQTVKKSASRGKKSVVYHGKVVVP